MKKVFKKKAANSKGETITETLVSVLIITLAMTMLAGSIVSASKVNRKLSDVNTAFNTVNEKGESNTSSVSGTVTLTHMNGTSTTADDTSTSVNVTVNITKDSNAYVYYK